MVLISPHIYAVHMYMCTKSREICHKKGGGFHILYDLVFPQQGMITNNFIDTAWKFFHYMWYGCRNEWANQGVRF